MSLFLSTYINRVDKKGRVSVPSAFRSALMNQSFQGIILFRSYTLSALEGFGMDKMEKLSRQIEQTTDLFSQEQDDLSSSIFADAQPLSFDTEGRILLPNLLKEHAQIQENAAFVGRGATFQIWNPDLFQSHQSHARERLKRQKRPGLKTHNENDRL